MASARRPWRRGRSAPARTGITGVRYQRRPLAWGLAVLTRGAQDIVVIGATPRRRLGVPLAGGPPRRIIQHPKASRRRSTRRQYLPANPYPPSSPSRSAWSAGQPDKGYAGKNARRSESPGGGGRSLSPAFALDGVEPTSAPSDSTLLGAAPGNRHWSRSGGSARACANGHRQWRAAPFGDPRPRVGTGSIVYQGSRWCPAQRQNIFSVMSAAARSYAGGNGRHRGRARRPGSTIHRWTTRSR